MPSKYLIRSFDTDCAFHVFNRGVEKRKIFLDKQDYKMFVYYLFIYLANPETIKVYYPNLPGTLKIANLYGELDLLTFCLMPNHFHLQIQPKTVDSITKLLKQISNAYTKYFNEKYDRVGHLFQGRYKAAKINNDELNIHVHRYIHLNPMVANLADTLEDYTYSSYQEYMNPGGVKNICNTETFLSHFGGFKVYREFLMSQVGDDEVSMKIGHLTID
jgi:putative transposase